MSEEHFKGLVASAIEQTFCKTLGIEVWKSLCFYFDVNNVAVDPEGFGKVLDKLFGGTSRVLKHVIGETLVTRVGGETDQSHHDFQEWLQIAWARFSSSRISRNAPSSV